MDEEDQRATELGTLEAIFPEIKKPDPSDPFSFSLQLPVKPVRPVTVSFPAISTAGPGISQPGSISDATDSHELQHLPALNVHITLPEGYPEQNPPKVSLSTAPGWLPDDVTKKLQNDSARMWEEFGRDLVGFAYIDHLQQEAEQVFGMADSDNVLKLDPRHKISLLDYDISEKRIEFEKGTFECGVCLDPKKGSVSHKMLDCGHIFCLECLRDFYKHAIERGELNTVRCITPNCAKERAAQSPKLRKARTFINPSELIQIGLSEAMVKRYVTLKYKTELEADKNTVYCPRSWCSGAAKSKKHRKPEGLVLAELDSEDEDEQDKTNKTTEATGKPSPKTVADLLAICEDCNFAFCSQCLQSWHGEFTFCRPPKTQEEITAEEKASRDYMEMHTSPCPTCSAPAQKTHGCNHMTCSRCNTHFCYLCGAWLNPSNPYSHFNVQEGGKVTSCYMRLWELEEGDGDDIDHAGRRRGPQPAPRAQEDVGAEVPAPHAHDDEPEPAAVPAPIQQEEVNQRQDGHGAGVGEIREAVLAREGPLMLRLVANVGPGRPAEGDAGGGAEGVVGAAGAQIPAGRGPRGGHDGNRNNRGGHQHQQHQHQQHQHQQRGGGLGPRGARAQRGGPGGRGRANAQANAHAAVPRQAGPLNQGQQAWVRRFVELALLDQEELMDVGPLGADDVDDAAFAIQEVP